jgi:hypothetical protein
MGVAADVGMEIALAVTAIVIFILIFVWVVILLMAKKIYLMNMVKKDMKSSN